MEPNLTVLNHPLGRHYLRHLRDRDTVPEAFRMYTRKLTMLLAFEATRELRTRPCTIETPMETTSGETLDENLVVVPILRAGLGMLDSLLEMFPNVSVGYMGLERDEKTARASVYYRKLPEVRNKTVMLVDPMLATGGSACLALSDIVDRHPRRVVLICIVAAPEGVQRVQEQFSDISIFTAALDRELNAQKFILPGLGDFGDRLFGTD